jgi:flavin reductase (DIM6/NTAB) family NADH-FMN oxidoreductase RutF
MSALAKGMPDKVAAPETGAAAGGSGVTDAFLAAVRHHPSGVAIITADAGEGPVALTVSSLISISATPPMVAV